jgi:hypothetical protein
MQQNREPDPVLNRIYVDGEAYRLYRVNIPKHASPILAINRYYVTSPRPGRHSMIIYRLKEADGINLENLEAFKGIWRHNDYIGRFIIRPDVQYLEPYRSEHNSDILFYYLMNNPSPEDIKKEKEDIKKAKEDLDKKMK